MTEPRPIIVGIDDREDNLPAIRWAVEDAATRLTGVTLTTAYRWSLSLRPVPVYADVRESELQSTRRVAEALVERECRLAEEVAAGTGVPIHGESIDGQAVATLLRRSRDAAAIVLGSRHLKTLGSSLLGSVSAAVAARAHCPVIVMRGVPGSPAERARVIVGIDGSDASQRVLAFAFDHAHRHASPLHIVLCWQPDFLATAQWRERMPASPKAQAWLAAVVAQWRTAYPDVATQADVVREHPTTALVEHSAAQQLLVVGSRGHHALTATLLGSVSQGVLHHATCPVAVVPTAGAGVDGG